MHEGVRVAGEGGHDEGIPREDDESGAAVAAAPEEVGDLVARPHHARRGEGRWSPSSARRRGRPPVRRGSGTPAAPAVRTRDRRGPAPRPPPPGPSPPTAIRGGACRPRRRGGGSSPGSTIASQDPPPAQRRRSPPHQRESRRNRHEPPRPEKCEFSHRPPPPAGARTAGTSRDPTCRSARRAREQHHRDPERPVEQLPGGAEHLVAAADRFERIDEPVESPSSSTVSRARK